MKHLVGKKVSFTAVGGNVIEGVVIGGSDDLTRILPMGATDEIVIFDRNIFSYSIIGEGTSGGYSGIKLYACRCLEVGCAGRRKLSAKTLSLADMGCKVAKSADASFTCDFGCVGAIEVLPSSVQLVLFEGMEVATNNKVEKDGKDKRDS